MKEITFLYTLKTIYDEETYKWLAEANWQISRRNGYQRAIYPIMSAMFIMLLYSILFRFQMYTVPIRILLIVLALFFLAAIPLSAAANKRKIRIQAIEDARKNNMLGKEITFRFANSMIRANVGGMQDDVDVFYTQVRNIIYLGDYVFLFFAQGAYTISLQALKGQEERHEFLHFLEEKCEKPVQQQTVKYF